MAKLQPDAADRPIEGGPAMTEYDDAPADEQPVEAAPVEATAEVPPAPEPQAEAPAVSAQVLPPTAAKEVHMPLMICSTCQGRRCVRHGGRLYVCPSCQGSGGVPLGQAPAIAPPPPRTGLSRAGHHLARGVPNSMPVGQRRRR